MSGVADSAVVVTTAVLRDWPIQAEDSGKEGRGRALVVGGSVANPGGVLLAARAAMRAGAGKIQAVVPEPVAIPMAIDLPEALVAGAPCSPNGNLLPGAVEHVKDHAPRADATLVGPGILDVDAAVGLVDAIAPELGGTIVMDALALAWLTEDHSRGRRFERLVISPNASELALTLGEDEEKVDADLAAAALRLAEATGAVVVSGKAVTYIACPDGRLWRSDEGNAGLGVAGSGDVKAGIILGLCARGADPAQAAVWATYLHGMIGGRLASHHGRTGFLASELAAEIPQALLEIG